MPRTSNKSNSKGNSRHNNKSTTKSKLNSSTPGRPKPMAPTAGVTVNRRRYGQGGGWCW